MKEAVSPILMLIPLLAGCSGEAASEPEVDAALPDAFLSDAEDPWGRDAGSRDGDDGGTEGDASEPTPSDDAGASAGIEARSLTTVFEGGTDFVETPSIHPSPGALVLAYVATSLDATENNVPAATGNGLVWEVAFTQIRNIGARRVTALRGMGDATVPGPLRIDFGGQRMTYVSVVVVEHTGVDRTGTNGSGAVVRGAGAVARGFENYASVTLDAIENPANATVGAFYTGGERIQPGDGYEEVEQLAHPIRNLMVEMAGARPTADASWDGPGSHWIGVALELRGGR